jgi:hypothetical protein
MTRFLTHDKNGRMRLATSKEGQAQSIEGLGIVLRQQGRRTGPKFVNVRCWPIATGRLFRADRR